MRIIACFASTLDGKIASKARPKARIGSDADLKHLHNVRNQADAILCGGETFREYRNVRIGSEQTQAPLQCILTQSFNLPPDAKLFQAEPAVSIIVFSPTPAPESTRKHYPPHVEWVVINPNNPVGSILEVLKAKGIQTLLVEGGGYIMHLFLEAKAVQELYLTLCPLLLGGQDDPTLVTGQGFSVPQAPRTKVLSADWLEQELYLHLEIQYP